ncbi:MAG: heavy-metal-associated domain-containing protein [Bacteroidetes bacterium]|nr:heavy-metal-associated domain-containing protein [Bacteroidota bacterium]
MKTEKIIVANLRCAGCLNTVTKKLTEIIGVEKAEVCLESGEITIMHQGQVSREEFVKTLLGLGYPEATEKNGLLTHLKSYGSCLTGKISTS